jgi:hypothetical protein
MRVWLLVFVPLFFVPTQAKAEFRSAKDMQKACRIALAVFRGTAENNATNALLAGECIGFVQGVTASAKALTENAKWYKICAPDTVTTQELIERFITFVDLNPKYNLASTALQIMLARAYPCHK